MPAGVVDVVDVVRWVSPLSPATAIGESPQSPPAGQLCVRRRTTRGGVARDSPGIARPRAMTAIASGLPSQP